MSVMVREEIYAAMDARPLSEALVVTPLLDRRTQIGAGSIDLRLGTEFLEVRRYKEGAIDPFGQKPSAQTWQGVDGSRAARESRARIELGRDFVLHPGQFVLGSTLEFLRLPNDIAGQVLSRSSWGRLGLIVATAVVVQPGFSGILTLELVNMGNTPVKIRPGLRVAQLMLWKADTATEIGYDKSKPKYRAPLGPESHRLAREDQEVIRVERVGRLLARSESAEGRFGAS
jgi:dCTP deaminase